MRLRGSGLTPPELADELLGRRIERLGSAEHPAGRTLVEEIRRTRLQLRVTAAVVALQGLILLVVLGLHLL